MFEAIDLDEEGLREVTSILRDESKARALFGPDGPKTVQDLAMQLLAHAVVLDDGSTRGVTYDEILGLLKRRFPMSSTSRASLNWYATEMRRVAKGLPARRAKKGRTEKQREPLTLPVVLGMTEGTRREPAAIVLHDHDQEPLEPFVETEDEPPPTPTPPPEEGRSWWKK